MDEDEDQPELRRTIEGSSRSQDRKASIDEEDGIGMPGVFAFASAEKVAMAQADLPGKLFPLTCI